jgi:hypothetical protein
MRLMRLIIIEPPGKARTTRAGGVLEWILEPCLTQTISPFTRAHGVRVGDYRAPSFSRNEALGRGAC